MRPQLKEIRIAGFRSLRDVSIGLAPMTLLIGPNGAGKSNLLSALRMVPLMRTQSLRRFVGEQGGASAILHYGPATTREIEIKLDFEVDQGHDGYEVRLGYAAKDSLVFLDETVWFHAEGNPQPWSVSLGAGHSESLLSEHARMAARGVERVVDGLLARMGFFHFHSTSVDSPLRQNAHPSDDRYLRSDGSNLAAFLHHLHTSEDEDSRASWNTVEGLVRQVAPFLKHLQPAPIDSSPRSRIRLLWTDERDHLFDVHDLSDGTLRAIALISALGQPASSLPHFITIDEPELGLHPAALSLVASLVRSISSRSQVLLSTQSPALLDEFEPEDVVVVELKGGESSFRRLDMEQLRVWLDEYCLSEMYDKNLLGGRP